MLYGASDAAKNTYFIYPSQAAFLISYYPAHKIALAYTYSTSAVENAYRGIIKARRFQKSAAQTQYVSFLKLHAVTSQLEMKFFNTLPNVRYRLQ